MIYDPDDQEPFESASLPSAEPPERRGLLIPAADVKPEPVEWLWEPFVPLRGVTLLVGDGGIGKSMLTVRLGAQVTRGQHGEPGHVIFSSVEDDLASVIVPRLLAAEADLSRLSFFAIATKDEGLDTLQIPGDVPELERQITETGARLVVIDPVTAHLDGSVESTHEDRQVRRALAPLHRIAAVQGCAIVVLLHLNKATGLAPLYRVGGSVGFGAAARSVLGMARYPDGEDEGGETIEADEDERLLEVVKSNYGRTGYGLRLQLDPTIYVPQLPPGQDRVATIRIVGPADATFAQAIGGPHKLSKRDAAKGFLRRMLADGPCLVTAIEAAAESAGLSKRTLERARSDLGVKSSPSGLRGAWELSLPESAKPSPQRPYDGGMAETGEPLSGSGIAPQPGPSVSHVSAIGSQMAETGDPEADSGPSEHDLAEADERAERTDPTYPERDEP